MNPLNAESTAADWTNPPLVGREAELERLVALMKRAIAGRGGALVLITGEPGIGKSRLATELAGSARADGWETLWGGCKDHAGAPPYWPWISALRGTALEGFESTLADELSRRTQLGYETSASVEAQEEARFAMFERVSGFLADAAAARPLMLTLDDLHWADEPSLQLLEYVAAAIDRQPILIVGTYLDGALGDAPALADALGAVATLDRTERVRLPRLPASAVGELLRHITRGTLSEDVVAAVYQRTAGNPFFAREVGRLLHNPADQPETATMDSPPIVIPDSVREAIRRRLRGLSDGCMELLALASVLGPEYDLLTLQSLAGQGGDHRSALSEAFAAGILIETAVPIRGYRFAHPLVREEVYDGLSVDGRERLHRFVGEGLEELRGAGRANHLTELAHHFRESAALTGPAKAVSYLRLAGEHAVSQQAWSDAIRAFSTALELHRQTAGDQTEPAIEISIELGIAHARAGDETSAVETLTTACDDAANVDDAALAARATGAYARWAMWASGGAAGAQIVPRVERALMRMDYEAVDRARLLHWLAAASLYLRDSYLADHTSALLDEALSILREADDAAALAEAIVQTFHQAWEPHFLERRIQLADELTELAVSVADTSLLTEGLNSTAYCLIEQGKLSQAERTVDELDALADRAASPRAAAMASILHARIELLTGDFAASERHARDAMEARRIPGMDSLGAVVLADAAQLQGKVDAVADEVLPILRNEPDIFGSSRVALARTLRALDDDEWHDIYGELVEANFETIERDLDRLPALAGLAELSVATGDRDGGVAIYSLLEPYGDRIAAVHVGVLGSVARHLGLLAAQRGDAEAAAEHFEHALDRNSRAGALPWRAMTQVDYAALLVEQGRAADLRRARSLLNEAIETARSLGMAPLSSRCIELRRLVDETPAPYPDQLTQREVEVLSLIAQGLSNAQIADRLVLSPRTVEGHISNLYGKIGASGRAAAATYAVTHHLVDIEIQP